MIGAVVLAHLVGDYLLQSDWMALEKTKRWWPAIAHGVTYTLPFLFLTRELDALALICVSHIVIDRFRLARHVCWAKNWLAPIRVSRGETARFTLEPYNSPWRVSRATGYPPGRPAWMVVWLMIIADNTLHLLFNVAAIYWLA